MHKYNGHLSNKNVLSNFLKEFLLREESFNLNMKLVYIEQFEQVIVYNPIRGKGWSRIYELGVNLRQLI